MSTENVDIVITDTGADKAKADLHGVGDASEHAAEQVDKLTESGNLLKEMLAGLGLALSIEKLIEISDGFTNLQNSLKLVSKNTEELEATQEKLLHVANDTRQSMEGTAALYTSLAIATKNLHTSQEDLLGITTTINQAMTISGKSADEVSQAMRRFSTSMSQGTLDSRGITTVLMQFPALARAIADGMSTDVGSLKTMAAQGQITAQQIVQALQKSAGDVQKQFAQMTPTIASAFTVLRNELDETIGKILNAQGAGATFGSVILFLAHNMDAVVRVLGIVAAMTTAYTVAVIAARVATTGLIAVLVANPWTATLVIITGLVAAFYAFGDSIKLTADGTVTAWSAVVGIIRVTVQGLGELLTWLTQTENGMLTLGIAALALTTYLVVMSSVAVFDWLMGAAKATYAFAAAMGILNTTFLIVVGAVVGFAAAIAAVLYAYNALRFGTDEANARMMDLVNGAKAAAAQLAGPLVESMRTVAAEAHNAAHASTDFANALSGTGAAAASAAKSQGGAAAGFASTGAALTTVAHSADAAGGSIKTTTQYANDGLGGFNALGQSVTSMGAGFEKTVTSTRNWDGTMTTTGQTLTTVSNGVKTTTQSMVEWDGSLVQVSKTIESGLNPSLNSSIGLLNSMTTAAGAAISAVSALHGDYGNIGGGGAAGGGGGGGAKKADATNWTGGGSTDWSGNATTNFQTAAFATGGQFKVGGQGGTDSQRVTFMATPGEVVTVQTPAQLSGARFGAGAKPSDVAAVTSAGAGSSPGTTGSSNVTIGAPTSIAVNLYGVSDAASFLQNKSQVMGALADAVQRAQRQLGRG